MDVDGGKVVTALHERWLIEQQIQALLDARSEKEFAAQARQVAAGGDQVIPVILRNLDRSEPRMLSVLGTVAALYPRRDQILNKLYQAAADVERPDRERMSAMLILERFLGQEFDPYLAATLDDPQIIAVESLKEMMAEGERDPFTLAEYARALAAQSEETFLDVIEVLLEVGQERAVPALCLLAQEQVDALAEAALYALGRLPHPDAVRGLQSLLPLLPPVRRALGERSLRKLQFRGIPVPPLPAVDDGWRVLVGPVGGQGGRVVWFIRGADAHGDCWFLGVSIAEDKGIEQAYGHPSTPASFLPEQREVGHVHRIVVEPKAPAGAERLAPVVRDAEDQASLPHQGESLALHMLETDFDYGRWLVQEGQALNLRLGVPLPVEYRLLGPALWQYDDAGLASSRQQPPVSTMRSLVETADLLAYPIFGGWFAHGERVFQVAAAMLKWMPTLFLEGIHSWAERLAEEYYDRTHLDRLRSRLEAMAEWLWRAGEVHLAELALLASATITEVPPAEHPFTVRMMERGLTFVADQLQKQQSE